MMKIALDYENGMIIEPQSGLSYSWGGLEHCEIKEKKNMVDALVRLKNAGFTADEIVELRRKDLI